LSVAILDAIESGESYFQAPPDDSESWFWVAAWVVFMAHRGVSDREKDWQEILDNPDDRRHSTLKRKIRATDSHESTFHSFYRGISSLFHSWIREIDSLMEKWTQMQDKHRLEIKDSTYCLSAKVCFVDSVLLIYLRRLFLSLRMTGCKFLFFWGIMLSWIF
jgi:hypothetical protein